MKRQKPPNDIGEKIKKIRGDLSQAEFARRVGIKRSLISSYESGERLPSLTSLKKLASYGRVSIEYLLGIDVPLYKLTPEEDKLLHLWCKSPPEPKSPLPNIFLLLLIIGSIMYLKYLDIW